MPGPVTIGKLIVAPWFTNGTFVSVPPVTFMSSIIGDEELNRGHALDGLGMMNWFVEVGPGEERRT